MESLIIESIKIYGFDTYYLPRTEVARDNLFLEDPASKFQNAIPLEMYLENVDGFAGESTIMSKFGLESRDSATFVVARMRWEDLIGRGRSLVLPNRPAEGDLIYLPLTNSYFEIKKVDAHNPFFQLGKLYVYKLECELYQYSSEDFDTGIARIDSIEDRSMDLQQRALALESGDQLQLNGASDDLGILIYEGFSVENNDPLANNDEFNLEAMDILDFSEVNPFGEVVRNV